MNKKLLKGIIWHPTAHSAQWPLSATFWTNFEPKHSAAIPHLEESGLATLPNRVDPELVEAARGGDGGVVVDPLPAVDRPVVVAVVVNSAVPVKHQPVLTNLLIESAWEPKLIVFIATQS